MKNAFDERTSTVGTAEGRISELQGVSVESLETEKQRDQRLKNKTGREYCGASNPCGMHCDGNTGG